MTDKTPARKHAAGRSRFVAAGVGVAAMAGLVAQMDVTYGRAQSTQLASVSSAAAQKAAAHAQRVAAARAAKAVAKANRPIVLTPHAVVKVVNVATSSSGSSGGYSGGSAYVAPAPAAAPVASTSGSH
jgi:hypothetical protein